MIEYIENVKKIIEAIEKLAVKEALWTGDDVIRPVHILLAILRKFPYVSKATGLDEKVLRRAWRKVYGYHRARHIEGYGLSFLEVKMKALEDEEKFYKSGLRDNIVENLSMASIEKYQALNDLISEDLGLSTPGIVCKISVLIVQKARKDLSIFDRV